MTGRAAGCGGAPAGRDGGTMVGRDAGTALGRGDGAALDGLDGTVEPLAVFVLILSLGAGSGTGDEMAGGVATDFGILTVVGADLPCAELEPEADEGTFGGSTGVLVIGFGVGAGAAAGVGVGAATGVATLGVAAGAATFFIGCCINGISGVEARESG